MLRYWKSKDVAMNGSKSLKGVEIPLKEYYLDYSDEPTDGMYTFAIVAKPDFTVKGVRSFFHLLPR